VTSKFRPKSFALAVLSTTLCVSLALASSLDTPLSWFASRPMSQQATWDKPMGTRDDELLRQAYVMAELSQFVYSNRPANRDVDLLGFTERKFIKRSVVLDGGDAGAFIGATVGGALDVISGGATAGLGIVVGGHVGHAAIKNAHVDPEALVVDSFDRRLRVVSLRGTSSLSDVLLDANAGTIVDESGDVTYHHGFFLYASVLYGEVRQALGDACEPGGAKVWLTGHSLGGAAAQLLAFWLDRDDCTVDGVVTFGAPSPGRDDFQFEYNLRLKDVTHRFMHERDPVACLPLGADWASVGHLHSFTDTSFNMNRSIDLCTGNDGTLEGQVRAYVERVYGLSDPSTEYAVWLETTAKQVGLCTKNKVGRAILGVLTGLASEGTCRTLDVFSDAAVLKDQLSRLHNLALNNSMPYAHKMECSYIDRIALTGSERGTFMDPIWAQRMERTWQLEDCHPPPPVSQRPPPTRNAEGCPGDLHCCTPTSGGVCDTCVVAEHICNL
jgi:hypothetical protein